jgi:hypothetical protein
VFTSPLSLDLHGRIIEDIGQNPTLSVSVYLNSQLGPSFTQKLCTDGQVKISQDGIPVADGEAPTKGEVVIGYNTPVVYGALKKGHYTVRVEMYTSEEVGKTRMTGFEGAVWVEGKGDGRGG